MKKIAPMFALLPALLVGCGMSDEEKANLAAVTCAVMGETRNMDAAIRVREVNTAREKLGEAPYLDGDDGIKDAFEFGLCEELVLNDPDYNAQLVELILAKTAAIVEREAQEAKEREERAKELAEREAREAKEREEREAREAEEERLKSERKEKLIKEIMISFRCPKNAEEVLVMTRLAMDTADSELYRRIAECK